MSPSPQTVLVQNVKHVLLGMLLGEITDGLFVPQHTTHALFSIVSCTGVRISLSDLQNSVAPRAAASRVDKCSVVSLKVTTRILSGGHSSHPQNLPGGGNIFQLGHNLLVYTRTSMTK